MQVVLERADRRPSVAVTHRHTQSDEHTGERRVHARLQNGHPEHDSEQYVARRACDAQAIHGDGYAERHGAEDQGCKRQVLRIEDRNDHDRGEIVEYRQCEQKDFQRNRHACPESAEECEGERDVRRDGYRPSVESDRVVPVQPGIDRCRYDDSADRTDAGQHDLRSGRQLALQELTLDLQSDQEEKHRHEAVVDP